MREIILILAEIVNTIHDLLVDTAGVHLTDKELHFWVFGFIGIAIFFFVYVCFKIVEKMKWSTGIFAFIYTITMMIVLVFAIELQQGITNRGNMEFADAAAGLWGFLVFFMAFAVVIGVIYLGIKAFRR
ncbi:hypothetical protein [Virgibacillus ainsalahensis]